MKKSLTLCILAFLLQGCTPPVGPNDYTMEQIKKTHEVFEGYVLSYKQVNIRIRDQMIGEGTAIGTTAGALGGGLIGASVARRSSSGALWGGGIGALTGLAGGLTLDYMNKNQDAFEYVVELMPSRRRITVIQGNSQPLAVGQRVHVSIDPMNASRPRLRPF